MRAAGKLLSDTFAEVEKRLDPGVSGNDIDSIAETFMRSHGGEPAFKGYRGFPATVCFSPNDGVVHGIPGNNRLQDGDIISIDIGVKVHGFFADAARTYGVGQISPEKRRLIDVTKRSLDLGIEKCVVGTPMGDMCSAIQKEVEGAGYSVVRDLVGHGIGSSLHEEPAVPNFGTAGDGPVLKEGYVLAIEPMVNVGGYQLKLLADEWGYVTMDGTLSAHFEDTVAITADGPLVLTR